MIARRQRLRETGKIDIPKSSRQKESLTRYATALPLTLPSRTREHHLQLLEDATLLNLFDSFASIPDPRSSNGLGYDLPYLLTCLVAAMCVTVTPRWLSPSGVGNSEALGPSLCPTLRASCPCEGHTAPHLLSDLVPFSARRSCCKSSCPENQ
jgi:hypothetical protein